MVADPHDDRFGPRRSDPSHASAARIYDYVLGGDYYYPVDREAAEKIRKRMPRSTKLIKQNRMWVQRAVRHLVSNCGVTQFLDIGSGIPTGGNVHEVAQEIESTARVVYVDYERVAVDRGLQILEDNPYATSIHADMRQPHTILEHPATTNTLDFTQPIAMIWGSMLHFIEDRDDPHGIFARYMEHLKPGDYVALSHLGWPSDAAIKNGQYITKGLETYNQNVIENITIRSRDSIMRFFDGTELLEPGLVPLAEWRPDDPNYQADPADHNGATSLAGVGRLM